MAGLGCEKISVLARLLTQSESTVVFTGAGISTESGIPDYRSPGGVWDRFRPIEFADFLASEAMRREFWRRKFATHHLIARAEPNRGHRAVAELVQRGTAFCVVTQNVDGLHQKSGVPQDKLVELHGNTTYALCLQCDKRYDLEAIRELFERDDTPPVCAACGGLVKTGTISFGQPMPEEAMRRAEAATCACDLFLVVGSSLSVYPAAEFPVLAHRRGAKLVILNRDPTPLDEQAEIVLHGSIGEALGEAVGVP
jgi:NAD-dependent deacetylase